MAWSIFAFVADSADAQLAYLRVVLLVVLLVLPPPHDARMDSIPVKERPSASARNTKSRRLILPSFKSSMSLLVSFIDIAPIVIIRTVSGIHLLNRGAGGEAPCRGNGGVPRIFLSPLFASEGGKL